ncbi:PREDICTED: melanoma antigen preferentially expressed in tumors-like [Galeopterus variegatus]|uniref:Melanoma antigen preferentially expressed in tumors-like n=1 Tax=Galeopterus variegatus TaxID=482537 RepID=A0ABM0SAI4_GALVR|nr:PREDICTED: melanoma antigen preferentially expressed in tumors-like [Galeopterus variegatus]
MDQKSPATLLELAARGLLSNERVAIDALEELPRGMLAPFFSAAFLGVHKKVLKAMHSIMKLEEAQNRVRCLELVNSDSEPQSSRKPVELLVDISLDGTLRTGRFLSLLRNKVQQSFGSLHLCCRDLQIDGRLAHEHILQLLDMGCIGHLKVNEIYLSQVTTLLAQMTHLHSLSLSQIPFTSCMRKSFGTFLTHLGQMKTLQQIRLSSCRTHSLHELLRCLPPQLDALYLSFCGLSNRDITVLSQSPAAPHLRLLSLCNNKISWEHSEAFQTLLASVSGTLQHLEIDNCLMTDSTLTAVIPALSHCSHLRVFSFASKLQAQLKAMLQVVKRNDMRWTTSPE